MYRNLIILFAVLLIPFELYAQKENYNANVDARTYELLKKSDMEELRNVGFSAIEAGIDFFYLRLRLGISYYEEKNYMSAIPQFEKALYFKSNDTLALEYLYYSYLFSGLEAEANALGEKFPASLREKTGFKKPEFFKGLYTEGGYTFVPDFNSIKNSNKSTQQKPVVNYKLVNNETYLNLSLMHSFSSRVSYFQGVNSIGVNSSVVNNAYSRPVKEIPVTTKQFEYYGNLTINPEQLYTVFAAIHYLHLSVEDVVPPENPNNPPPPPNIYTEESDDMVYTGGLSKRFGNIEPGISALYSTLSGGEQHQETFGFAYYPFGNLNLYSLTNLVFHSNKETQSSSYVTHFIFDQKVGFKITESLWGEGVVTAGRMMNYTESNGFVVYNVVDDMNYKLGGNLLFVVSKSVELSVRYLFISSQYKVFAANTEQSDYETEKLYKHKIIGGLKWTF